MGHMPGGQFVLLAGCLSVHLSVYLFQSVWLPAVCLHLISCSSQKQSLGHVCKQMLKEADFGILFG